LRLPSGIASDTGKMTAPDLDAKPRQGCTAARDRAVSIDRCDALRIH